MCLHLTLRITFCFLRLAEFFSHEDAKLAVDLLDKKEFNGRQVHMRLDRSQLDCNDDTYSVYVGNNIFKIFADKFIRNTFFIGNLAWTVTDKELLQLFSKFCPIGCHVLTNMYGRSRGFAILKFATEDDGLSAIELNNDSEFYGRRLEVMFLEIFIFG